MITSAKWASLQALTETGEDDPIVFVANWIEALADRQICESVVHGRPGSGWRRTLRWLPQETVVDCAV